MSVADLLNSIEMSLTRAKLENEKLSKGTKSAAPKVRAALLEIGKHVAESRKLVLDIGKSIPVKHREPKQSIPEVQAPVVEELPPPEPLQRSAAEPIPEPAPEPIAPAAPKKRGAKKAVAIQ